MKMSSNSNTIDNCLHFCASRVALILVFVFIVLISYAQPNMTTITGFTLGKASIGLEDGTAKTSYTTRNLLLKYEKIGKSMIGIVEATGFVSGIGGGEAIAGTHFGASAGPAWGKRENSKWALAFGAYITRLHPRNGPATTGITDGFAGVTLVNLRSINERLFLCPRFKLGFGGGGSAYTSLEVSAAYKLGDKWGISITPGFSAHSRSKDHNVGELKTMIKNQYVQIGIAKLMMGN